jgi:monoamine oxidase
VRGFDAADLQVVSAKSIAEEWEGIGNIEEEKQFRLIDGHDALVNHLRDSLDRKYVQIRLNSPISEICWERKRVQVRAKNSLLQARHLIVTLPVGILQLPPDSRGSIRFVPDIPQTRGAAQQIGSGPVVKAILKFREPFWEDDRIAKSIHLKSGLKSAVFLHAPELPFPTWWTPLPLRLPVLTAWAGGTKARALAGMPQAKLIEMAMDSLSRLLNQPRARLLKLLEKIHIYDWLADPFSRGAYSYLTVGADRARAKLAKPIQQTLFFAGEATDTSGQASTVAGALASGRRAAREVLATL